MKVLRFESKGGGYGSENDVCLGYELRLAEPTQQKVQ